MKRENDLTVGNETRAILFFAIPMLIGNILQQLYNIADTAIVGNLLGDNALAAVGATSFIYGMFMGLAFGIPAGFSVVIARFYGSRNEKEMRNVIGISYVLGGICGIVLSLVGYFSMDTILSFLNTPADILPYSSEFIKILMLGNIVTFFYNIFSGVLRAVGNTTMPLVFLGIACICNIVLDYLFVACFKLGINGAAYATVLAQMLSAVLSFFYLQKKCVSLRVSLVDFVFEREKFFELFSTGISMGLMHSVVAIGSVAMQSAINGFGTLTIAAHVAGRRIVEMCMLPFSTLAISASTFSSQNFGAGRNKRIITGLKAALKIAAIWSLIANLIGIVFAPTMVKLLTGSNEELVIDTATLYIRANMPFYFILIFLLVFRNALQGLGRKKVPLLASFMELVLKFLAVWFLVPKWGYLGICFTEPITWILCTVIVSIDMYIGLKRIGVVHVNEDRKVQESFGK